jgi:amino acid transporter
MGELASDQPRLRRNAVGLTGAVVMSAAIMGPAISTFFNPQFSTQFSGEATPFVYLACLLVILVVASGIAEMAHELPSAGAFYTYVAGGLGPRAGFVTGGLMFVADALLPPAELALIGSYLQTTLRAELHIDAPWWLIGLVPAGAMMFLAFEGIRASLRAALILFAIEVGIVVLLAIIVVGHGGRSALSLHPLDPSASPHGFHGLATGCVFAALSFVGFEAAATLAVDQPRRRRSSPPSPPASSAHSPAGSRSRPGTLMGNTILSELYRLQVFHRSAYGRRPPQLAERSGHDAAAWRRQITPD